MEIKNSFLALIVLAAVAVFAVLRLLPGIPDQTLPGQALPGQTEPSQMLPGQALGIGTLKLYLSDAPPDSENATGVYITITEILYHLDGQWTKCEEFVGNQTYDLLELTDGNSALLGEFTLPAGNYSQIRFMLDIPDQGSHPANPGCYIAFADNSTEPLFVPSGGETGYKATGHFIVPADGTVKVTADFDVHKAVVVAGSKYILKPTIKLIVNY